MYPQIAPDIQETLRVVQDLYASGATALLSPDAAKAFNTSLGLIPYNLEAGAKILSPVITPFRNLVPRNKGYGKATEFKAITAFNAYLSSGWTSEGTTGPEIVTSSVDVLMPYKMASLYNYVTFESQYFGRGQVDAKALAVANLLRAFMIDEEDRMLFGNFGTSTAAGTPGSGLSGASSGGSFTNSDGTTGGSAVSIGGGLATMSGFAAANLTVGTTGSIPNATYDFYICGRTGPDKGFNFGATHPYPMTQEGPVYGASASTPLTQVVSNGTNNTASITVVPGFLQGAIGYVLYWKAAGDTYYQRVAFSGAVTLNSYTTATSANGTAAANLPGISTYYGGNSSGNNGDLSCNYLAFCGAIAQILAAGSGATVYDKHNYANGSGSTYKLNATPNTTNDLDNIYQSLWLNGKADPKVLMVHSYESIQISNALSTTPFLVQPMGEQGGFVGSWRVSRITNKVTGSFVDIRVHPTLSQGVMLFLSNEMPPWYPGTDIPSVWSMEMSYDYLELDYPPTQPRWPIEIRNAGALLLYFPLIQGIGINFSQ